jgi:hypothetical protein
VLSSKLGWFVDFLYETPTFSGLGSFVLESYLCDKMSRLKPSFFNMKARQNLSEIAQAKRFFLCLY